MANFSIPEYVTWYRYKDSVVLFELDKFQRHVFTQISACIWHQIVKGTPLTEWVDVLKKRYDVDTKTAKKHINDFIEELQKEKLIYPVRAKRGGGH